jgi:phage gp29-like protein
LFEQSGNDGVYYREAPYNKFVLEVGRYDDFGLLLKAAPYVIYKRGDMGNWANFTQLFGMPFREARYSGYNEATRLQIEQGLQSMGSAGYGIFPDDAKIDFHEANNVQANGLLYDTLRKACNEELSMLILGQTGTTIQTPGKLGGENTNAQTEDDINADDRKFELAVMNEKVLPILSNLGYKVNAGVVCL